MRHRFLYGYCRNRPVTGCRSMPECGKSELVILSSVKVRINATNAAQFIFEGGHDSDYLHVPKPYNLTGQSPLV